MKFQSPSLLRGVLRATTLIAAALLMPSTTRAQSQPKGRVEGVAFDSTSRRPLRLATVQLLRIGDESDMRTTGADSAGRFRFDDVAAGEWMVGAWHARLDSVGVKQLGRRITVEPGKRRTLVLSVPSARTLIRQMCGDSTVRDSLGLVFGTVRQADRNRSMRAGSIRAKWTETLVADKTVSQKVVGFDQLTSADGDYVACGVPADLRVQLQASAGEDSSGVIEVQAGTARILRVDFYVAASTRRVDTSITRDEDSAGVVVDTALTEYRTGVGRVEGVVRRGEGPLSGALVTVWGTGIETRSDAQGRFSLVQLPLGTHTIDLRVVGYQPLRQAVDIFDGEPATPVFTMERATGLDTVRVRAWATRENFRFDEAEFLKRRRRGAGIFFTPEELSRINPVTMSQLYARAQFVRVRWDIAAGESITMGSGLKRCVPVFILDGIEIKDTEYFMMQRPDNLLALEIYRGSSGPPEFAMPNPCGTIVAWTGRRLPAFRSR